MGPVSRGIGVIFFTWIDANNCCDRGREMAQLAVDKIAAPKKAKSGLEASNMHIAEVNHFLRARVADMKTRNDKLNE